MRALIPGIALSLLAGTAVAGDFTVTTPAFQDGGTIPLSHVFNAFGCKGKNISPALSWSGAPASTKSFAITMYDPDASTGSGWWHWTVYNLPASVHHLRADAGAVGSKLLPKGAREGRTDFGFSHYGGPCPPVGDAPHHYEITVYAVKTPKLALGKNSSGTLVGFIVHSKSLATARIVGLYGRPK